MPTGHIEHANLTVTNPQRSAALFERLCGWRQRWRGPAMNGGETIHVGDDHTYLALYTNPAARDGYDTGAPLNHVGLAVDDLDAAEAVVRAAGLKPFNHGRYDPGPRTFYFRDWDGIEFEVVAYQ
ncbi:VOC family protein [Pelagerythrobacter sp.]|uniref:VOC family protein n=1 Tax=Pelagerythrobacter sp. TaxID=2800702 RepID=UPI0035B2CB58